MTIRSDCMPSSVSLSGKRYAFTLMETAIVLGVSGVILGALWYAVTPIWNSYNTQAVMRQMTTVRNNLEDAYTGTATWSAANIDLTPQLATQKVLPPDMVVNGVYQHALGGTFKVITSSYVPGPAGASSYTMQFAGLTFNQLLPLLQALPLADRAIGFEQVLVNGTSCAALTSYNGNGGTPVWTPSLPLLPQTEQACSAGVQGKNGTLSVIFKLHP